MRETINGRHLQVCYSPTPRISHRRFEVQSILLGPAPTEELNMPDLTYFSPKVVKRSSLINGRGLFATAAVAKGEVVVVKGGYILTRDQRDQIGEELGPSEVQITEDLFIGPCVCFGVEKGPR
jgi:hypothetical protein